MPVQTSNVEVERIRVNNFKVLIRESLPQKFYETFVLLDRDDMRAFVQRKLSESAEPRTNFHHVIAGRDLCLIDDPAGEIAIVQKILPETFHGGNADLTQERGNFGELHRFRTKYAGGVEKLSAYSQKAVNKIALLGRFIHKLFNI